MSASKVKTSRVGDLIVPFDKKNIEGFNYPFYGINKDKTFMPTVADTLELDNHKYKVVSKGVFVFSGMQTGRDVCIRIAVYDKDEPILVSPAYTTFKVKEDIVLPVYLFCNSIVSRWTDTVGSLVTEVFVLILIGIGSATSKFHCRRLRCNKNLLIPTTA